MWKKGNKSLSILSSLHDKGKYMKGVSDACPAALQTITFLKYLKHVIM